MDQFGAKLVPVLRELVVDDVLGVLAQECAAHVGRVLRTGHFASGEPQGQGAGGWKDQILTSH